MPTSTKAIDQRVDDLLDRRGDEHRGVPEHVVGEVVREALLELLHASARTCRATSTALAPGDW